MRISKRNLARITAGLPPEQSEADFQKQVLALARLHGWRSCHFRAGLTKSGRWVTAVQGDGVGFVDIVLCRERVLFCELKSERGALRPDQETWIAALRAAHAEVYVWRPSDWPTIQEILR